MKRRWWMAVGLALSTMLFTTTSRAQTLVIQGDIWCPVNCELSADQPGFMVELAQQVFGEAGIHVKYRVSNWARAIQEVRAGRADGLIGAGLHDAPDFLFGKVAPVISRTCFYARPGSRWRYTGADSLESVRVGAINGYSYGEEIDQYVQRHLDNLDRVQLASGEQALAQNVRKVELGRVDVTPENTWVMLRYLAQHDAADDLIEVGCRTPDVPIYIAFAPDLSSSARYRDIFDAGVRRYQHNGRLEAILRRYGVKSRP